jgi:hypothetical protein
MGVWKKKIGCIRKIIKKNKSMETAFDRMNYLITERLGWSVSQFEEACELQKGDVARFMTDKNAEHTVRLLRAILKRFPTLRINWILSGQMPLALSDLDKSLVGLAPISQFEALKMAYILNLEALEKCKEEKSIQENKLK